MLKDATYKEKFSRLDHWLPTITDSIKKDLRNEHLRNDWAFVKHYFAGKNVNKLTNEELAAAYKDCLSNGEKSEELGEFITNRWLLKNTELYHFFEQELSKINPNFHEITILEPKVAAKISEEAVAQFGSLNVYIFSVLNSVVFPAEIFASLEKSAREESNKAAAHAEEKKEKESVESMQRSYEQQIARLTDKYEKKLLGLQKKYITDTDSLKKQVSLLQRKLAPAAQ